MKEQTKLRQNKGITLIALVITIIILLILASISIAMLTGDNGLLTKASLAKENTRGAEVQEIVDLAVTENTASKYTNGEKKSRAQVIKELSKDKKLTPEEVALLENQNVITIGTIDVDFSKLGSIGMTLVEMYDKAVADGCTKENGNCTDPENHLHIGDYVDYLNPTTGRKEAKATDTGVEGDQIYEASKNQLNWQVLGKDETTGGIKLISGRPMKSNNGENDPYLHMYGAKAYLNAEAILDDICGMYTSEYGTAESVKQKDIDEVTGILTPEDIKGVNLDPFFGRKTISRSL